MLAYYHGIVSGVTFSRLTFSLLSQTTPSFSYISLTMGGGDEDQMPSYPDVTGHILFAWPFDEPKAIISRIQRRYPNLQITYHNIRENGNITKGFCP